MTPWTLWLHDRDRDVWREWVVGTLEDVLTDSLDLPQWADALRIERSRE